MTEQLAIGTTPQPFRLSVDDFLLLDRSGALDGYAKTELLRGTIFCMNSQYRPHARIKSRLHLALGRVLAPLVPLEALVEATIAFPPHDAPEPDIVVTREPEGGGLIPAASVALIIEVSDTTLQHDLKTKLAIYAAASVPEYWVVDVNDAVIHQFWSPDGAAYADRRTIAFGQPVTAATISGLVVDTATL